MIYALSAQTAGDSEHHLAMASRLPTRRIANLVRHYATPAPTSQPSASSAPPPPPFTKPVVSTSSSTKGGPSASAALRTKAKSTKALQDSNLGTTSPKKIPSPKAKIATTPAKSPKLPKYKDSTGRVFGDRKAYLYAYYDHLLKSSKVTLLFEHDNIAINEMNQIRRAIKQLPTQPMPFTPRAPVKPGKAKAKPKAKDVEAESENSAMAAPAVLANPAQMLVVRTGILSAVAREQPKSVDLTPWLKGQRALITCPSVSPTYLKSVLAVIKRIVRKIQREEVRGKETKQPKMNLIVAVVDGKQLLGAQEVEEMVKIPELDTLRAQVVGLLEGSGRNLVGVLSQAGGGSLVRTLQGLEESMKEPEAAKSDS